ncbi:MAG: bifunctional diguanylate cyclase/phosphodiesterase [Oscillospiraceae bacterium]|nr:bifunctional diguanylate cyclase/phosphodiesterase [Oscillospiraceae bacterium]
MRERDCLILKNEKDIENIKQDNLLWYHVLKESGVSSVILFPLRYEHEILGFLWATNFDIQNIIPIKETLELTTFFIAAQLESYKMMERLRHISYTDRLTGLPNRFACHEFIKDLIQQGNPFTMVSIDINNFKSINSTMGLDAGNEVLTAIASRWKAIADSGNSGTKDYITRISGDEFALVIQNYQSDEELLQTIKQYEDALNRRMTIDECDFYITASFGYVSFPDEAKDKDSVMSYATVAMREVKRANSSNHIIHFTPDLLKTERILEIENKIRTALENDTIYFNLQPQYDMNHVLRGFEALARMKDKEGHFISPAEFIPVAEKVGLIDKVDSAVFRKSTAFFGSLLKKSGADLILSINVSVRHLMKNDFLEEIKELLYSSGIPAEKLEIEITESIMIDSAEKALKCINEIRQMGVKIAIDDFGTGYSSLSYLNSFPANLLKIDKSFIDKMNTSESSKQYVAAIISIGHIMGFDVISEGIEEQEQLETLRSIGCDFIQGFLWGRPLMQEDAKKLVVEEQKNGFSEMD